MSVYMTDITSFPALLSKWVYIMPSSVIGSCSPVVMSELRAIYFNVPIMIKDLGSLERSLALVGVKYGLSASSSLL